MVRATRPRAYDVLSSLLEAGAVTWPPHPQHFLFLSHTLTYIHTHTNTCPPPCQAIVFLLHFVARFPRSKHHASLSGASLHVVFLSTWGCVFIPVCVCVYMCVRVCSCPMRVCLYVDVAFHWVSSLPSETQAREEDHSAFSPSYCHLTQWMMHCSQTHTCRAQGGTRAAQTGTHGLGCVSAWAFVLCTCCFKTNVRELQ